MPAVPIINSSNAADITSENASATYQIPFENQYKSMNDKYDTYTEAEQNLYDLVSNALPASTASPQEPIAENLIRRQYEVNEWTTNNRLDTVFVLQMVFIGISICSVLAGLYRMHIIGAGLFGFVAFLILLILIVIIVRRAQYTRYSRDQRYWNRRTFDKAPPPPVTLPTISCTTDVTTTK